MEHPSFPPEVSVRKPISADNRRRVLEYELIAAAMEIFPAPLVASYLEGEFTAAITIALNDRISKSVRS